MLKKMEKKIKVKDDKSKKAESPVISNTKLESQKKTAISKEIQKKKEKEPRKPKPAERWDPTKEESRPPLKQIFWRKPKVDRIDETAFKGSKNIQTNKPIKKLNSNGTISVDMPKLDLSPKGNGSGKRFTK